MDCGLKRQDEMQSIARCNMYIEHYINKRMGWNEMSNVKRDGGMKFYISIGEGETQSSLPRFPYCMSH